MAYNIKGKKVASINFFLVNSFFLKKFKKNFQLLCKFLDFMSNGMVMCCSNNSDKSTIELNC